MNELEELNIEKKLRYVVGVDLGGTKIATALHDHKGKVLHRVEYQTTKLKNAEEVINCLVDSVKEVRGDYPILGVGVASPGAVDTERGIILNGTNLPGWSNIPLQQVMESKLELPVQVVNDANAAAWGEYYAGAGRRSKTMVYVTISTGIGSGIVLDGKLVIGSNGFAGELGHTSIGQDGPQCSCGQIGCWEAYASGTSMARFAAEAAEENATLMTELAEMDGTSIGAKHLFEAAALFDKVACEVVDEVTDYVALGLKNIVHTFNPDCIVIGGGVSSAGDDLFTPVFEKTRKLVMKPYRDTFRIVPALLGKDVGVIGAATLCFA
ncbi:ROK family protein [Sporosarcina sp. G11-34]|uniref:ROK family protein n=1 Tax=Sporosarcina sp. G11-34 TaxID=2849605 RepID=UPI0022A9D1EB|nr:ROK family protein [Sporosarcina sp. G11-34]MCZ2258503.1 ROK family protein [Sporosarcina sp. G11-34]